MSDVEASVEAVFANVFRGHPCVIAGPDVTRLDVPADAWTGTLDGDAAVLDLCTGPTLDVGCGPGRMTQLLAERGEIVLGIDVVAEGVETEAQLRMLRDLGCPLVQGHLTGRPATARDLEASRSDEREEPAARGVDVRTGGPGGLPAVGAQAAQVGDLAHRLGVRLHELSQDGASLEQVYLELTGDAVEFRGGAAVAAGASAEVA